MRKLLTTVLCMAASFSWAAESDKPLSQIASAPKFGAYIIGSYKYSDKEGANDGPGFNARMIRAYVDGTILTDFKYRLQLELSGTPHVRDFYLEYNKYKEASIRIGQYKRCFGFENPMNPWDVGIGDYSQATKKLIGMGDACGEPSNTGGRDQGLQVTGDLFPVGKDQHTLIRYQVGVFNGNGINKADNNQRKDIMGNIQIQPVKGLYLAAFGWKGDYNDGTKTIARNRYALGAKYDHNNWTLRSEYIHSAKHSASATPEADAFYALAGVPVNAWLKVYGRYDLYRSHATSQTAHHIYSLAPNFRLHKNLMFQLQYNHHFDKASDSGYNELWLQTYVRF